MSRHSHERDRWRVLLAEDNDDHALLIQMALERASHLPVELHRARNGNEAVEMIMSLVPDLILLDLKMPGRTGHEVLEVIKGSEELRRIPVAVLTSSDRDDDVAQAYGLGGNHYITKPENPIELEAKLRSLLKNVEELSFIRRGSGRLDATAASAMGPGSFEVRQVALWGVFALVLISLAVFAYVLGVL
ncbi:MAG: response regulator [Longimicrobiales bacterium]|nr:response regulator [Longimicrobiales bacterium]